MKGLKRKIRDNRWLNWSLIFSNWLLQGIWHSDKTEKIYRIFFTFFFWCIAVLVLVNFTNIGLPVSVLLGFIFGHSLNWLVNGNFYNLIIHRLMLVRLSKSDLFQYLELFEKKIRDHDWVLYAASFGSICKGKLKDTSDIDISIVRKKGFRYAVRSILFSIREKKYADLKGIPLEIYISDTPMNSINRFKGEKNPVVLYDPEQTIDQHYVEKLSLSEAIELNSR